MCDEKFTQQADVFAKIKYLQGNEHKLGNVEGNLLIAKYMVVCTYNYIATAENKFLTYTTKERAALIKNIKADLQLLDEYLQEHLAMLKAFDRHSIQTHFIDYLTFIFHYCYGSLIELGLLYRVDKQPDDIMFEAYLVKQSPILEASLKSLKQLEDAYDVLEPFYLGNQPFHDFPLKSYSEIRAYLKDILDQNHSPAN